MESLEQLSDFDLIDRSIGGDDHAFKVLVQRHQSAVATVAFNLLGDQDDAYEIGQQVFIQFHRSLHNFRREASLKTYLSKIAVNRSLNEIKRKKRQYHRFQEVKKITLTQTDPNTTFEEKELIHKALMLLDEKYRTVVVLRKIQQFDTLETSDILGIPKGTVLSRLKRGMEKLRHILENDLNYTHE